MKSIFFLLSIIVFLMVQIFPGNVCNAQIIGKFDSLNISLERATLPSIEELSVALPNCKRDDLKTWLDKMNPYNRLTISSKDFTRIAHGVFYNAKLIANSCGNINDNPHEIRFSKETLPTIKKPLNRLSYTLTSNEKNATLSSSFSGIPLIATIETEMRTKNVRACASHWYGKIWRGAIKDGKLQVTILMRSKQNTSNIPGAFFDIAPLIKTSRKLEYKYTSLPYIGSLAEVIGWQDLWKWKHPYAQATIKDYQNGWSRIIVTLYPIVENNRITYQLLDVEWISNGERSLFSYETSLAFPGSDFGLFTQVPSLEPKVINSIISKC